MVLEDALVLVAVFVFGLAVGLALWRGAYRRGLREGAAIGYAEGLMAGRGLMAQHDTWPDKTFEL